MVVALLLLFAAVWIGLGFANALVAPIGRLITAAERVRAATWARVPEGCRKTSSACSAGPSTG